MKTLPIPQQSPSAVITPAPKFHLVKGGKKASSSIAANQPEPETISDHVGFSHPNEIQPSSSKTNNGEKSPEHVQAINDAELLRAGKINRTELKRRYAPTYTNWSGMKSRCKADPTTGISPVALHPLFGDFAEFLRIMGPRPEPTWSLDRRDPTGPYSPDNVRWASKTTQSRNRTNAIYLTYRDVKRLLVQWAEWLGQSPDKFRQRRRLGWTDEEIIEDERKVPQYNQASHPKSREFWSYTPWPTEHREQLERLYQTHRSAGEHRLTFAMRYAPKRAEQILEEIDRCYWPDYYTPSATEVMNMDKLTKGHGTWLELYRYSLGRLSSEFAGARYRSRHLPDWVENQLSACA